MTNASQDMPVQPPNDPPDIRVADSVPLSLQVAAGWAWRLLLITGLIWVVMKVAAKLSVVLIPVAVALLLAALLVPMVRWLERRGLPRGPSSALVTIGGLATVAGVLTFVVQAVIHGLPDLQTNITDSLNQVRDWLVTGPPNLSPDQIDNAVKSATEGISSNREALTSGALTTASALGQVITGGLLTLFTLIFFLYDGPGIWQFVIRIVPVHARPRVDLAGHRGFASLVGYVRATVLVAFVDATGIGVGLAIVGVPLALPLAALVFLGSFIPIVGALLSGLIAVLVALVTVGPVGALVVLAIVLAVQQLEGHILQPLLMGRAVQLHALAVVLSIAAGVVMAGIVGALLAVPMVAVVNAMVRSLRAETPLADDAARPDDAVDAAGPDDVAPPDEPAVTIG
jgi:predicted PurR-regulated permease PerM